MKRLSLRLLTGLLGLGWLSGCSSTFSSRPFSCGSTPIGVSGTPCCSSSGPILDDMTFQTVPGYSGMTGCPSQMTSMPGQMSGPVGMLPSMQGSTLPQVQSGPIPQMQTGPYPQMQSGPYPQMQTGPYPQSGTLPQLQSVPPTRLVPDGNAVPIQANPSSRTH